MAKWCRGEPCIPDIRAFDGAAPALCGGDLLWDNTRASFGYTFNLRCKGCVSYSR